MGTGWGEVYSSQYGRLVALVTAVVGSRVEAEDAVQEAFVRALGFTGRRGVGDAPEAWLYRVAVNIARSRWRRVRAGRRAESRWGGGIDFVVEADGRTDARLALLAALRTLPFAQREALALHYLADLPLAEIAARTGCPLGTVKARLSRGREALARLLGDESVRGGQRDV